MAVAAAAIFLPRAFLLALPWIAVRLLPLLPPDEAERLQATPSELGTNGDLFGMLNCLALARNET
jgi:hypothetical protein